MSRRTLIHTGLAAFLGGLLLADILALLAFLEDTPAWPVLGALLISSIGLCLVLAGADRRP